MTKSKLERFSQISTFSNVVEVIQRGGERPICAMKGKWHSEFFKNNNPIVLELGCGKGEYTVGLGERFKDKNFLGIDLKGNRIWCGAKTGLDNKMSNIGFVRSRIENIDTIFAEGEVEEIWITFPDPQPQSPRERKRLTYQRFIDIYKKILKPGGVIHLKTDSRMLYDYTLEVVAFNNFKIQYKTSNLYADEGGLDNELAAYGLKTIQTYYEKLFSQKGFDICYLRFSLV